MRSPLFIAALALALALAGAGCWTTTVGSISDPRAQRWLADNASSEMVVETADRAPDRIGVLIQAASPTEISFRTRETTVVPIERIRRLTVVKHGWGALEGAGIGAATGALLGALYGATRDLSPYERSIDCTIICNNSDAAGWEALLYGVIGFVGGTLTGVVIGHRDILDLR